MNREELMDFLRDNLEISIDKKYDWGSYAYLTIELLLEGKVVSSSQISLHD